MKLIIQIEIDDTAPILAYQTFRDAFQFTLDDCRDKIKNKSFGMSGETVSPHGVRYKWNVVQIKTEEPLK